MLLILIDGTWIQAHHMLRHSAELLAHVTQVQFDAPVQSDFDRLRREPAAHCMSTVEACARALRALEPAAEGAAEGEPTPGERAAGAMEEALRVLVRNQLRFVGQAPPRFVNRKLRTMNRRLYSGGAGRPPSS